MHQGKNLNNQYKLVKQFPMRTLKGCKKTLKTIILKLYWIKVKFKQFLEKAKFYQLEYCSKNNKISKMIYAGLAMNLKVVSMRLVKQLYMMRKVENVTLVNTSFNIKLQTKILACGLISIRVSNIDK